ncbi:T9SS type A sorting domain-containing protein [Hymenobacter bucti]|uniref:T9SS type A sorting domain-containing protein n=1 Tax=Hymenobacter bucti TaxID=1844114 RepID=A0ABW4QTC7_9BACT
MYNSTLRFCSSLLTFLLAGFAALPSAAQSQMRADTYQNNRTFLTKNPGLAVDELLTTSATVDPALIGGASLRVTFPTTVQTGQQGILIIKSSSSLATVLGGMSLHTFSTTAQNPDNSIQDISLSNAALVQISVAPNDPSAQQVKFTATKAFNQLELDAGAVLNTNYSVSVYAVFGTVAPLPVQLTTFQGKATEMGVALKWETASEHNADYVEVQRAEGLTSGYNSLGQVKSAGTSTLAHTYQFVDAHATGLHYYRLRQVDYTGAESFSPVVAVDAGLLARLTAYPTIATTSVQVSGPAGAHLTVFDEQGKQVHAADLAANQPQPLDVSGLPGGLYFLRDAATGLSTRFIKSSGR